MNRVGELLAGRYLLGKRLGAGGFAEVLEALDHVTGQRVAVKLLKQPTREAAARFAREARVALQLKHPNTVRLLDVGESSPEVPFLVLELLTGETLAQALRRGPLSPPLALHVMSGLLASLAEAHALGVVHRDIKPDNVFLCGAIGAARPLVKVLDFGVAKDPKSAGVTVELAALRAAVAGVMSPTVAGAGLTGHDLIVGTPRYMAPEQISGDHIGPAADVFAAGLVMIELYAGRPVFEGGGAVSVIGERALQREIERDALPVPAELRALVSRATAFESGRRWQTAGDMLRALEEASRRVDVGTTAPATVRDGGGPSGGSKRRLRLALPLVGALALGALGAAAWSLSSSSSRPESGSESQASAEGDAYEQIAEGVLWFEQPPKIRYKRAQQRLPNKGFANIRSDQGTLAANEGTAYCFVHRFRVQEDVTFGVASCKIAAQSLTEGEKLVLCTPAGYDVLHCSGEDSKRALRKFAAALDVEDLLE